MESERSAGEVDSFAVVAVVEQLEHFAAVADKLAVVQSADSFAERGLELALVLEPVLAFFSTSDIAAEHTFAAAECKSVAVAYSWDFRKSFEVGEQTLS